ncbi:MAG: hypothetical protein OEM38_09985 [Gammaproteobacteria bacterium]|nr:hypothetical protein [Gammaproteobacteria bacterium]
MSNRTSHVTQPSESDFRDSHPIDDKEPSIGDLSSIETVASTSDIPAHSVGDISGIDSDQPSEALGDMSLLDEALAEMDESDGSDNTDIPVLSEAIETPPLSRIVSMDDNASIPLLDQEATIYAEMLKPASPAVNSASVSSPVSQLSNMITEITNEDDDDVNEDEPLFDSPLAENNSNISEMNNSLEMAAELMSEASDSAADIDQFSENDDAALAALLDDSSGPAFNEADIDSNISDLELDIASELTSGTTSIDEKIAMASSEAQSDSDIEINDLPIGSSSAMSEPSDFSTSFADGLTSSHPSSFIDQDDTTPEPSHDNFSGMADSKISNSQISEFNPETDLNSSPVTQASHRVDISGQNQGENINNFNLSIPFELHSQLSQKIDELVIEATSSITEELHSQLTSRLDDLLSNAVESVLPRLVNQMAEELRADVNGRIKQHLPNIINDVLNKTRLNK